MGALTNYQIKPQPADVIEAIQWDGTEENAKEIRDWFDSLHAPNEHLSYFSHLGLSYIMIKSGHFSMTAREGDYIVRSSKQRSEPKKFSVYRKEAFEAGFMQVDVKPMLTSDEALIALKRKLKLGV